MTDLIRRIPLDGPGWLRLFVGLGLAVSLAWTMLSGRIGGRAER